MIRKFQLGLLTPIAALKLIFSHRALLIMCLLPLLIALTLQILLGTFIKTTVTHLLATTILKLSFLSLSVAHAIASGLGFLISFIIGVITFSIMVNLVSIPLNDILAETTEKFASPRLTPAAKVALLKRMVRWRMDGVKTVLGGAAVLFSLLISWIPILGVVGWILGPLSLSYTYVSFPETRRDIGVRQSIVRALRHSPAYLGMGLTLSLFFSIPLISFLFLPVAVVSGTALFARLEA